MNFSRRLAITGALSAAALLSAGAAFAQDAELRLGLSMPTLNTPFFTVLVEAATAETEALDGSVVQTTNANRDASQQVTDESGGAKTGHGSGGIVRPRAE